MFMRMMINRRLVRAGGLVGVLLASLGLLTCVAGTVAVWAAKNRAQRVTAAVFNASDDALEFIATQLVLVNERLLSSREQVNGLAARAERLKSMQVELAVQAEAEPLTWTLDMLVSELKAAERWLDSIEAVA